MRDIPSAELVREMKLGWCLGNTLDSDYGKGIDTETGWGNVRTTKEIIAAVIDRGFNIIRFPVTWRPHMDSAGNVDPHWMDRVNEVVDYAYERGVFVILNTHHENWYDPYYTGEKAAAEKLELLWKQIGTRFADHGERLIFEGLNEPRKRNTPLEWNGGDEEGHDVVNRLNAAFVKTVRGLGGNNSLRHLMVPTYAASVYGGAPDAFVMPEGDGKLIVSVHAYCPYAFALEENPEASEFSEEHYFANDIRWVMDKLKTTFIDKGLPVIMGEMGAVDKSNLNARTAWSEFYIRTAKAAGIPCLWWDNGNHDRHGDKLGLLDRSSLTWQYPEIVDALFKGLE